MAAFHLLRKFYPNGCEGDTSSHIRKKMKGGIGLGLLGALSPRHGKEASQVTRRPRGAGAHRESGAESSFAVGAPADPGLDCRTLVSCSGLASDPWHSVRPLGAPPPLPLLSASTSRAMELPQEPLWYLRDGKLSHGKGNTWLQITKRWPGRGSPVTAFDP